MALKTIRSQLCATEETREYLWHLFIAYTLLINQLLERLPKDAKFSDWRKQGRVPRKAVAALCNKVLEEDGSLKGLPARFYTSVVLCTSYTFASIFAIQNKLRARCEGKQRWLNVAEHDLELAEATAFSLEEIRERAAQILGQAESERQECLDEEEEPNNIPSIMSLLFKLLEKIDDPLSYRAIAHLLRNDCKVSHEEEDPEKLALRLSKKRIQIERLQEQLNSQLPIGRDPTGERTNQFVEEAISLPRDSDSIENRIEEFETWEDLLPERIANLSTQLETLPYPLLLGSNDDISWSWETISTAASSSITSPNPSPKRTRTRRRRRKAKKRICVSLKGKGLSQIRLRLYCDRRQLPIFRQFVEDSKANKARNKKEKFSLALYPLRSATLLWAEDPKLSTQENCDKPWNSHRLYLHVTVDTRLLTAEGTEQVRQEKIELMHKFLKGLVEAEETQEANEDEEALLSAQKNRSRVTKKNQTTLKLLESNPPPPRPSQSAYRGNPQIAVKVAFSREHVVGVAVSDGQQPILDYRDVETLLIDSRLELLEQRSLKLRNQPERLRKVKLGDSGTAKKAKRTRYKPKISARQLQLQPYRLLKRWRRLKRKNVTERRAEQKHGLYRQSQAETNLAHQINHILARNIVDLCQKWSAGTIILPEFGDLRESIESEIQAKAKRKYPDDNVERQKQYAKEFRMQFHRWNYKHLSECIRLRAAKVGITCIAGQQPRLGTLREKAIAVTAIPPKPK
jgi:hypothetical protein